MTFFLDKIWLQIETINSSCFTFTAWHLTSFSHFLTSVQTIVIHNLLVSSSNSCLCNEWTCLDFELVYCILVFCNRIRLIDLYQMWRKESWCHTYKSYIWRLAYDAFMWINLFHQASYYSKDRGRCCIYFQLCIRLKWNIIFIILMRTWILLNIILRFNQKFRNCIYSVSVPHIPPPKVFHPKIS